MTTNSLHAWVLHKRWSGDTSANVSFFTMEQGLVHGLCKGGRTPKKQSLLQAFQPLWVVVKNHRDWHYIQQLEISSPTLPLTGPCLFAALYMNELLHHILRADDPYPELYLAYVDSLHALIAASDQQTIEVILRRFERILLAVSGYEILLTHDNYGLAIDPTLHYTLIAGEGFRAADKGISGAHILAFSDDKLNDSGVLKSVKWFMRRAIDHAVDGKPIKSRSLYATGKIS